MIFSEIQRGNGVFTTDGRMRLVENMRCCKEGIYVAAEGAKGGIMAREGYRWVTADRRDGQLNMLTWNGATLALEGVIDSDGDYSERAEDICLLADSPEEWASVGEYLVIRLKSGMLHFLLWEADLHIYTSLGCLPELPEVELSCTERSLSEGRLSAITFKEAVSDFRSDIPAEVSKQVGECVRSVWDEMLKGLHDAGRWVQPVMARIGYRLWDGTLYALSDAIAIDGMKGYAGSERVVVHLEKGTNGYTGTKDGAIGVESYGIKMHLSGEGWGAWSSVIRYVEVYITGEQEAMEPGLGKVSYSSGSDTLGVALPLRDLNALAFALKDEGVVKCARVETCIDVDLMLKHPGHDVRGTAMSSITPPSINGEHICGHGGFLHVSRGSRVMTMQRGNPFVVACESETGSRVAHIGAQPCGGGAYTRQYVYLFTDKGIYGMVHDTEGLHRNCRPISDMHLHKHCMVSSEDGLWVLSEEGNVALLHDAKVEVLLRGVRGVDGLAWRREYSELWLTRHCGGGVVICGPDCGRDARGYVITSDFTGKDVEYLHNQGEIVSTAGDGELRVWYGAPSGEDSSITWATDWEFVGEGNIGILMLHLNMRHSQRVTVRVEMRYGREERVWEVGKMEIKGPVKSVRCMGVRLPSMRHGDVKCRITVSGNADELYSCNLITKRRR